MRRFALIAVAAMGTGSCLFADFSYEQTSKMTGGAMMSMVKVMGALSKQMREPIRSTVMVKGDRMANLNQMSGQVIDLSKETITQIDFQKKTYSVVTFAQMAEFLKQMEAKMSNEKGEQQMDMSVKASVKETGQTKQINGMDAKQALLIMEMEGTDKKTGKRGTFMTMTADVWLAKVAGYDEVQKFHARMAQKLNWMPGSSMFSMGRSDTSKGMAELYKEMSKLSGVPVYQLTKMGMGPNVPNPEAPTPEQTAQAQQQQQQQRQQAAENAAVGSALGRLGGRFGGLGGLRRKKQEPEQQQQQAPAEQQGGQAGQPQGAPGGTLMEMTSEVTSFSSAPVDASKFEVPAGFKQVESDMLKMRK